MWKGDLPVHFLNLLVASRVGVAHPAFVLAAVTGLSPPSVSNAIFQGTGLAGSSPPASV